MANGSGTRIRLGFVALLAACGALALVAAQASAMPQPGKAAPGFAGKDSNGKLHRLSDLKGKTVVLEWSNHLCPFVGKHYSTGNMQALQREAADKGVVWLTVISSAPGKQGYVEGAEANELTDAREAAPAAVILDPDGTIGRAYGAKATPHMAVIDGEGQLVYIGAIDDKPSANREDVETASNYVRAALKALADGTPVATPVTRAYGCSVKY